MSDKDRVQESVARARSALSNRRDGLSAVQRELLAKRLGGRLAAGAVERLAESAGGPGGPGAPADAAAFTAILGQPPLDLAAEAVLDPAVGPALGAGATSPVCAGTGPAMAVAARELRDGTAGERLDAQPRGNMEPARVLLTGATGYLGAFLLAELLRQTRATVVCLVRAGSAAEGAGRLRQNLVAHEVWDDAAKPRIEVQLGDLAQPLFGLTAGEFAALGAGVDAIYHNGAWVHSAYPYSVLKAANVLGTQEALRLAFQSRIKPLHFVSTLDVFFAPEYSRLPLIAEDDGLPYPDGPAIGYAQTKWVAERLVMEARRRGLPAAVYRFGRVSWHSRSGIWNADDALRRVVDACIELGAAPDIDVGLVLTPVDFIAGAIAGLSRTGGAAAKAFHLINPQAISSYQLAGWMQAAGTPIAVVPAEEWLEAARAKLPEALLPNLARLRALASSDVSGDDGLRRELDTRNAAAGLSAAGIVCPPIGQDSVRAYLARHAAGAPAGSGAAA
ncbi:MAG TPA: thioester reductase domain-containing protein [Thermoanaerobaculia bacterium]|nr:thioester reductase domain-containing protein [Thermoanaerobaculia bacterium]